MKWMLGGGVFFYEWGVGSKGDWGIGDWEMVLWMKSEVVGREIAWIFRSFCLLGFLDKRAPSWLS